MLQLLKENVKNRHSYRSGIWNDRVNEGKTGFLWEEELGKSKLSVSKTRQNLHVYR